MNLIEQLGGYERAKHEFKMIEEMTPRFPDEVKTNNRLLLEHRRQHNIFEVEDKVIFYILGNEVISYSDWLKSQNKEWIRHATDLEIAAGRRL